MRIFLIASLALMLVSTTVLAQSYDQRMRDHRLPDRQPSSASLQMFRFGKGRVGEPLYVKESPGFNEYEVSAAPFIIEEEEGPVKVLIKRGMRTPIYLDSVELKVGAKVYRPVKATADGKDVTAKLKSKDSDCACFEELTLEFPRIDPADVKTATLTFTAAAGEVAKTVPVPVQKEGPPVVQSSKYFNYKPGSQKGSIVLDGAITPKEALGRADLKEHVELAQGEGKDYIYMWVRDDGSNLSVALDVAADNTVDEADDKTVLYVRGKGKLASFTAGAGGGPYGRMGAGATEASESMHRVYEFVIPFSALPPLGDKGKWGISFAVTM